MRDLSTEQRRTLLVVTCLRLLHGSVPRLEQIAEVLGCSRQAAHYRLHYLEKKGFWNAKRWAITADGLRETRGDIERVMSELLESGQGPARNQHTRGPRPQLADGPRG